MPPVLGLCAFVVPYCLILALILLKLTSPERPEVQRPLLLELAIICGGAAVSCFVTA